MGASYIEIMDTTLRDGEQTSGVSFVPHEKLLIVRMLLQELCVDRVEVASARVSEGEKDAVTMICRWARQAGRLEQIEVLGFIDGIGHVVDGLDVVSVVVVAVRTNHLVGVVAAYAT